MSQAAWGRPSPTRAGSTATHNGRTASPHPHAPQAQVRSYHAHAPAPIYVPPHMPAHLSMPGGRGSRSPGVLTAVPSPRQGESAWANCPAAGVPGPHMNMGRVCAGDAAGQCIYCRRRVFAPAKDVYSPSPK